MSDRQHCIHALTEHHADGQVMVKCAMCDFTRAWPLHVRYHPEPVLLDGRLYPVTVNSIGVNICAECHSPIYAGSTVGIMVGDGEHSTGLIWFHYFCAPVVVLCDPSKIALDLSLDEPAFAI